MGTGGDHELDVVSILRRARDPQGLAELRRAIEELRDRLAPNRALELTQILEAMQETRAQVHAVALAVAELARREPAADHLVDVTGMESFTPQPRFVEPPVRANFFCAEAVSVLVTKATDRGIRSYATIEGVEINNIPQLPGPIAADRWRAPAGRGHPVRWGFSCMALVHTLYVQIRSDDADAALFGLTLSGKCTDSLPNEWLAYGRNMR